MLNKKCIFSCIFFLLVFVAFSQEDEVQLREDQTINMGDTKLAYYYTDQGRQGLLVNWDIRWEKTENILNYEVIIRHWGVDGGFDELDRVTTSENFIRYQLRQGVYLCSVYGLDFSRNRILIKEKQFEIFPLWKPVLTNFSPNEIWLNEDTSWTITVLGQNLLSISEFFLIDGNKIIIPSSQICDGETARLVFTKDSLVPGTYNIFIRNIGDLDATLGSLRVEARRPYFLNISLGYNPIIPLYGFLFDKSDKEVDIFPKSFFPLSLEAKVSFTFFMRSVGYIGAELSMSPSFLKHQSENKTWTSKAFFMNTHLSFLYQYYLSLGRIESALNANIGFGISPLFNFRYEFSNGTDSERKNLIYPSFKMGVSFSVFVYKPFYVNVGMDYIHMFSPKEDGTRPGILKLFIGAGIRFKL